MPEIRIENEFGHYVAYVDGIFCCSGDTFNECYDDLVERGVFNVDETD